ncbi:MAG TPA: hypothetical protein VHX64_11570 [Caulobacteraceae bacterium]|jgi:MFS family permease|nr:hypothetical protein [Caulobacteraceae bacterium]
MDIVEHRTRRVWGYLAIAVAGGAVIAFAAKWVLLSKGLLGLDYDARALVMVFGAALAMVWTMTFSVLSFHSSDEFKQRGSMIAWYWGGTAGLAVAAPIYVFIMLGGLTMIGLEPRLTPAVASVATRCFMMGFMLPVLLQIAGFFAVRTWWRASKR